MNTREDIEIEILKLMDDIFVWFAELSPYFINAITFQEIKDSELPYFRDINNIIRICHIDEIYQTQGEENHLNQFKQMGFESPFTFRAIQYKSGYFFIDMFRLANDYSWELRQAKELEIEDLYNLIYSLIRMYNCHDNIF